MVRPLLPVAVLAALPALLAAQQASESAPQATFRTDVASVEVDVVVLDRRGNFVRDLSPEDFEISEDDRVQEVRTFSFVDMQTSAADEDFTDTEGRRFIMVLNGHGPRLALIARQFVDEAFGPNDLMSVYYTHPVNNSLVEAQTLTGSRVLLRAAIRNVEPAFRPFPPLRMLTPEQAREQRFLIELEKLRTLERAIDQFGPTAGRRKAVLWYGGGFPVSTSRDNTGHALQLAQAYRDVIRAATRHHVIVYPVDPAGLTVGRRRGGLSVAAELRGLADDTGGTAIVGTNDFGRGYQRIVRELSTYYLLGYSPPVVHRDGEFHEIRVRVKRSDVTVRARKGYFAEEPPPARRPSIEAPSSVQAALTDLENADGDAPRVAGDTIWFRAGPRPVDAFVRVAVPEFSRTERLRLEVQATSDAAPAARLLDRQGAPRTVPLRLTERPAAADGVRWIVVEMTLAPMARGEYVLEVSEGDSARAMAFRVVP